MLQFKFSSKGLSEMRKKVLTRIVPLAIAGAVLVLTISTINTKKEEVDLTYVLLFILFFLTFIGFTIFRVVRKQKRMFESYTLTFENNVITRQVVNTPTINIHFDDITEVVKYKSGGFAIRSKNPADIIIVPRQIENYNALEEVLNQIVLITENKESLLKKLVALIPILIIGLMVTVNVVEDKITVVACGAGFVGLVTWCLYELQRNKNVSVKLKRKLTFLSILLTAIVIWDIAMKLGVWD